MSNSAVDEREGIAVGSVCTVGEQGVTTEREWVRCPEHNAIVPLSRCESCSELIELRRSKTGRSCQVICRPAKQAAREADARVVLRQCMVAELMTRNVICAQPSLPLVLLVGLFAESGLKALPVVNELGKVVGIVSESDVLRNQHAHPLADYSADSVSDLSALRDDDTHFKGTLRRVRDVMTGVVVVLDTDPITRIAATMAREKEHRVVVLSASGALSAFSPPQTSCSGWPARTVMALRSPKRASAALARSKHVQTRCSQRGLVVARRGTRVSQAIARRRTPVSCDLSHND